MTITTASNVENTANVFQMYFLSRNDFSNSMDSDLMSADARNRWEKFCGFSDGK